MRLILYPTGLFVFTFLLQLFFIIITERKRKTDKEVDCKNKRIVKKALIALVISLFFSSSTFGVLPIWFCSFIRIKRRALTL